MLGAWIGDANGIGSAAAAFIFRSPQGRGDNVKPAAHL
jgi:hypothetical protein